MSRRIATVLLLVALRLPGLAYAEDAPRADEPWLDRPLEAPAADVLAAAGKGWKHGSASAQVQTLLTEDRHVFDGEGRRTLTRRRVTRVMTAAGVEDAATAEAYWKPWRDEPPLLRARVIRRDGTELRLDPATVTDNPVSEGEDVFDDRKVRQAPLPGVESGAVVETEIVTSEKTALPGGTRYFSSLGWIEPSRRYRVVVESPDALPLAFKVRGVRDLSPRVEKKGGVTVRTWDVVEPEPLPEPDPGPLPSDVERGALLELATGRSWADVAATYARIVDGQIAKGARVALPAGLPREASAKVQAVLDALRRDVRYASVAFGEADIVPAAPAESLARHYGDCKDQATLLVSQLRSLGIPAYVALLDSGPGREISPELPALGGFDHAIVNVPGLDLWIDPTSLFSRAGELPLSDRDRWALVCREGVEAPVRTPRLRAADSTERVELTMTLADEGRCDVSELSTYSGWTEERLRASWDGEEEKRFREQMEEYARTALGKATLTKAERGEPRDLSKRFHLLLEAKGSTFATTGEGSAVVQISRGFGLGSLPETSEEKRRTDLAVTPFTREMVVRVVPPRGFEVVETPPNEEEALGPATLTVDSSIDQAGVATVTLRLVLDRDRLTPDEAAALHAAVERVSGGAALSVRLLHGPETDLNEGRIAEAFTKLRQELKDSGESAVAHRRLSRALLRVGLGDAARREAREAVRKAPASPAARRALARALGHDSFGRAYRPGWDPDGVAGALAEAGKLDADDLSVLADEAEALEYDARGSRYADSGRLAAAIGVYEKLLAKVPRSTPLARAYSTALLFAGRPGEVTAFVNGRSDASSLNDLALAALAVRDGVERAREEGRRRLAASDRGVAFEKSAELLVSLRRYAEAAELYREAARSSQNAAVLGARADLSARISPVPPAADAKDAETVLRTFLYHALAPEKPAPEELHPFAAQALRPFLPEVVDALRGAVASAGYTSREVARDVTTFSPEWFSQGTPETGIRMRRAGMERNARDTWLASEGGELRVLSVGIPDPLCRQAEFLLGRGDLAGARSWLQRALEMEPEESREGPPLDRPVTRWFDATSEDSAELALSAFACQQMSPLGKDALEKLGRLAAERPEDDRRSALLAKAELATGDAARVLELARALHRKNPDSETAATLLLLALRANELSPEAIRTAREQLDRKPQQLDVRRVLSELRARAGDFDGAAREAEELLSLPRTNAIDLNNAAWYRMVAGRLDEKTLSLAQRAVDGTAGLDASTLNTLGTVYAEVGRPAEARAVVNKAMDLAESGEPDPSDWYIVGRLLESFGLVGDAREAYRKALAVKPSSTSKQRRIGDREGKDVPGSPAWLATRRLGSLGEAPGGSSRVRN